LRGTQSATSASIGESQTMQTIAGKYFNFVIPVQVLVRCYERSIPSAPRLVATDARIGGYTPTSPTPENPAPHAP
jgi:hypothetical protein